MRLFAQLCVCITVFLQSTLCCRGAPPQYTQEMRLANGVVVRATEDGSTVTIIMPPRMESGRADVRIPPKSVVNQIRQAHRDLITRAGQGWWDFVTSSIDGIQYIDNAQIWSGNEWALGYAMPNGNKCIAYIAAARSDSDVAETIVHEAAHCSKKGTAQFSDQNYAYSVQGTFRQALNLHCPMKDYWGTQCQ